MLSCDLKVGEKAKDIVICESGNKNVKVCIYKYVYVNTILIMINFLWLGYILGKIH